MEAVMLKTALAWSVVDDATCQKLNPLFPRRENTRMPVSVHQTYPSLLLFTIILRMNKFYMSLNML